MTHGGLNVCRLPNQPQLEIKKDQRMAKKLQQADRFPALTLKLVDGSSVRLPDEMPGRYAVLLFYRGHW